MLAAYLSSMVESIGDYHSCARISEAPPPIAKMISKALVQKDLVALSQDFYSQEMVLHHTQRISAP
jgi:hypothetical protein